MSEFSSNSTRYSRASNPSNETITGTVSSVNIKNYTVTVVSGNEKTYSNTPILDTYGSYFNQDITWLKSLLGTTVACVWLVDRYYVLGVLPFEHTAEEEELAFPVATGEHGGAKEDSYGTLGGKVFKGRRANDIYDGDKILKAGNGGELSLLREGVARLKAGPLSQFILGRFKEFGRLITRVFKHFTDFGEVEHYHTDEGRVGLYIKGGADYKEESHPSKAKWTVQSWIGDYPDDPDSRLYIRVNEKENSEFVTLKFDIGGNLTLETSQNDTQDIGNERVHNIVSDESINVGGDAARNVSGNWDVYVSGEINITSDTIVNVTAPTINLN